jgi:hypothetical protein
MMNTQLSYLNNRIVEGNKIVRWSAMGGGSYSPGFGKFYNGATFSIEAVSIRTNKGVACKREPGGVCHDWSELAATSAVIYRGNRIRSHSCEYPPISFMATCLALLCRETSQPGIGRPCRCS